MKHSPKPTTPPAETKPKPATGRSAGSSAPPDGRPDVDDTKRPDQATDKGQSVRTPKQENL